MRSSALWTGTTLAVAGVVACHDVTSPTTPAGLPAFVYVEDTAGFASLLRHDSVSTLQLTSGSNNYEPNSVGTRLVFTSERDGYPQVYISDVNVDTAHRVMNSGAIDRTASLSPSADSIVFVSARTGVPRIWVIAAPALTAVGYDTPAALATGSASYTPEDAPAWSPAGGQIAFTSVRSGTSQVYVVPSGGGAAVAVTSESGGAFEPAWSGDGKSIYYIAALPGYALRRVPANGGLAVTVVADSFSVAGPASCNVSYCLYSTGFPTASGDMSALRLSGNVIQPIFARNAAKQRQPAILAP